MSKPLPGLLLLVRGAAVLDNGIMIHRRPVILYAIGVVLLVAVSYAVTTVAFIVSDRMPAHVQRSGWFGFILNGVTPLLGGVLCGWVLARLLIRWRQFHATLRGHFFRAAPWYLFGFLIIVVIYGERANSDFRLWSQLITWPLAATVGALMVDVVLTGLRARRVERSIRQEP